jgi:hypothetical protein
MPKPRSRKAEYNLSEGNPGMIPYGMYEPRPRAPTKFSYQGAVDLVMDDGSTRELTLHTMSYRLQTSRQRLRERVLKLVLEDLQAEHTGSEPLNSSEVRDIKNVRLLHAWVADSWIIQ